MKTNKIKHIALLSLIALILNGCNDNLEIDGNNYKASLEYFLLSVSNNYLDFSSGRKETQIVSIKSQTSWRFSDVPSWLSITPESGTGDAEISITSSENDLTTSREAIFYVVASSDPDIKCTIKASQSVAGHYIEFPDYESAEMTLTAASQTVTIDVSTNIPELTAKFAESWGTAAYDSESGKIMLEVEQNESRSSRSSYITVSSASSGITKTEKFEIIQLGCNLKILDGESLTFDADGGTQTKTIFCDLSWTAKAESDYYNYLPSVITWIKISPTSGKGGNTDITVTALSNHESDSRTGYVNIYLGDKGLGYIKVSQIGRYINLSSTRIQFTSETSSTDIEIESNIEWEITDCPEWISVSPMNGEKGKTTISVTASTNNSSSSRSGHVYIADSKSGSIQKSFSVYQYGTN